MDNVPRLNLHPEDHAWDPGGRRLQVRVDNKTVADLVNGRAALDDDAFRPIFVRIMRSLVALSELGWLPMRGHVPLVRWRPRKYNNVADHVANHVLETRASWTWRPVGGACAGKASRLILCCDGGFAAERGAAASSLVDMSTEGPVLVGTRGTHMRICRSAFEAESVALDEGLQALLSVCR